MNDSDRHDQIEALAELERLLDDEAADAGDIRDAGIRAVNRFDASIAAHGGWQAYSRRGSSDPGTRAEAAQLGNAGVERHPEYPGRLRRRIGGSIAEIAIRETCATDGGAPDKRSRQYPPDAGSTSSVWMIELRHGGPWTHVSTSGGRLADAEMIGARRLAEL